MMNKKIIGIFICILFFGASTFSSIGEQIKVADENETDDFNILIKQAVECGVISNSNWLEQDKLLASDGASNDRFGYSVSLDDDTALIGAFYDDDNGGDSGSVYVFTRSGTSWTQQAKLLASDGAGGDRFGFSVSLDDDTALIGAYCDDDNGGNSGSVYVFTRSGTSWTQQAKLLASDGTSGDLFGISVSIDNDTALIGAYGAEGNEAYSGSAYVFTRSGTSWSQQAKLLASDGSSNDVFGYSVSLGDNTALIGAYGDDDNGGDSGSAYVFIRSGTSWTQQAKLLASDGATLDYFGHSVSLDDDTAIIGARYDDDNGGDSGSVYVFTRSGTSWTQQAKLLASDGTSSDKFGGSVSIDNDTALIGAYGADGNEAYSGSAYVFTRSGTSWTQQAKLLASDGAGDDFFGISVSLDDDTAFIGAFYNDDNGADSGSAYIFIKNHPPFPPVIFEDDESLFIYSVDEDGDDIFYMVDWDDGTTSDWFGPYQSGEIVEISHEWSEPGFYDIKAKARDIYGTESNWSDPYTINFGFHPPTAPEITGPVSGNPGTAYLYTFMSNDTDGDDVSYYIRWGDGSVTDWTLFQASGPPGYIESHSWDKGTYIIQAKARDTNGNESDWSYFEVTIPRSKAFSKPILNFLQSHPFLFPLLQKLIQQLGFGHITQ